MEALTEYNLHIKDVKQVSVGSIIEIDGNKDEGLLLDEIARILKLNISNGPRKPPRVFLLGPPGCGKGDFAKQICSKYNLVYVQVTQLLKNYLRENKEKKDIKKTVNKTLIYPDEVVVPLVIERVKQRDCT